MPGGDRTGPWGMGPRTGRAAGYCAGYAVPGFANPVPGFGYGRGGGYGRGRGFGRGRGRGGGFGRGFGWGRGGGFGYGRGGAFGWGVPYAPPIENTPYAPSPVGVSREDELQMLKGQAEYLERALGEIQKRIEDIEKE